MEDKAIKLSDIAFGELDSLKEDINSEAETTDEPTAKIADSRLKNLCSSVISNYIDLARLLFLVKTERWYTDLGYEDFDNYCSDELGFKKRKSAYFLSIYNKFVVELGVPSDDLKEIGWSKAGLMTGIVTKDNVNEWIDKAKTTTIDKLTEDIKDERPKKEKRDVAADIASFNVDSEPSQPAEIITGNTDELIKMNFTLYPEQHKTIILALQQAQKESKSEKPGYLLEVICLKYLASI